MSIDDIVIACTLDPSLVRERIDEWRGVVAAAAEREEVDGGVRLRFARGDGEHAGRVAALAQAERDCCPFFRFVVSVANEGTTLDVTAPEAARPLVDVLLGWDG